MDLTAQEKARIKGNTDKQDEDAWQGYAEVLELDEPSFADKQVEDPLQRIARMREEEQKEILEDQRKLRDMRTEHLKRIIAIRKKGRK